jgi:hypothetical protein
LPDSKKPRFFMSVFRPFWALARATLIEAMQQPAALMLMVVSVVMTTLVPLFEFHRLGDAGRLARDSGLACMLLFGLLLAMTAAGHAVAREIAQGTAAAALAKPVRRGTFLTAKVAGILALVALFWLAMLNATLLAERASERPLIVDDLLIHATDGRTTRLTLLALAVSLAIAAWRHFRRQARFGVTVFLLAPALLTLVALACGFWRADGTWQRYTFALDMRLAPVALLILLALSIGTALAAALATRLSAVVTTVTGMLLALLGLAGDALAVGPRWPGTLAGGLLPNLQNYWLADALLRDGRVPWSYVGAAAQLAATWCAAALLAGTLALKHKELG